MDETKLPLFQRLDKAIFESLDRFKLTPNFNPLQDFYNGLEEEQQKLFKGLVIISIFALPSLGLGFMLWQNNQLKSELALRTSIVSKANEIIGQSQGLLEIAPQVFSTSPIDSESMMSSRVSGLLSSMAIDLSKLQVSEFSSDSISSTSMKSEAKFTFTNMTTDELMNVFTLLISREKFKISAVDIKRNPETGMLQGEFHGLHYSSFSPAPEGGE